MTKKPKPPTEEERLDYLDFQTDYVKMGIVECCYHMQVIRCIMGCHSSGLKRFGLDMVDEDGSVTE
jgi:hypothetical protein